MAQGEGGEEDEEEGRGEEGEGEEGERGTVAVECLAVLKNSDLSAELRRLECSELWGIKSCVCMYFLNPPNAGQNFV